MQAMRPTSVNLTVGFSSSPSTQRLSCRVVKLRKQRGDDVADASEFDRPVGMERIVEILRNEGPAGLERLIRYGGSLAARIGMLSLAIQDRLGQPQIRNYPPAIFLAYKWETDEHQAWVRRVAAHLKSRGYRVCLDQDHLERDASNYAEVPQYIANMAGCDVFLVVMTDAYVDMVTARRGKTTWVHDEYSAAVLLHNNGHLRLHGLRNDPGVQLGHLAFGMSVTDLVRGSEDFEALDAAFPVYEGVALDAEAEARLRAFARDFDGALQSQPGDSAMLRNLLLAHYDLESLYDYRIRLCQFCWQAGDLDKAHAIALPLLGECEFDDHIMHLAQVLDEAGDTATLFKFLHQARRSLRLRDSVKYHYFMAETLYEHDSMVAARNHFGWLCRSPGFAQQPPGVQDIILDRYKALGEIVCGNTADCQYRCKDCGAEYGFVGTLDKVCGDCGTLHDRANCVCPVCCNDGIVPLRLLQLGAAASAFGIQCPVCGQGTMEVA
jgi:hypothetical protein